MRKAQIGVLETEVLKVIYRTKRDEVIRGWKELYNEKRHHMRCSPDITVVKKSRVMRWEGQEVRVEQMRNVLRESD
jgi:hypothetical protein